MKRLCIFAALVLTGPVFAQQAAEDAPEVVAGIDMVSAYVWRGITYNDGSAVQPRLLISRNSLSVEIWGDYDIDDYHGTLTENELSEIDLTLSWGMATDYGSMSLGYVEYLELNEESEQNAQNGTREAFIALGTPAWEGLSALATAYYDFDERDDFYASAGFSYSKSIEDVTLKMLASAGYAGKDWALGGKKGFHDLTTSAQVAWSITDRLAVSLEATFIKVLDDEVLPDAILTDIDPKDDVTTTRGFDVDWVGKLGVAYIL